ncbi:hypothetical protein NYE22_21480 [Bacillus sp. FSL K6-1560]|uniref:hypothetical protein n=1 Tax=Bacillus sp. FSL K6-1560 TaxID=2975293 RepID=UPI0031594FE2
MEWGKVFDLLKTILTSWPLAAVVIVFAIRKSLKAVIENRLFSFKVGNVEIIFDQLLKEAAKGLESGDDGSKSETENVEASDLAENADASNSTEKDEEKSHDAHVEKETEAIPYHIKDSKENYNYKRKHFTTVRHLAKESPGLAIEYTWSLVRSELVDILLKYGAYEHVEKDDKDIIETLLYNSIITKDLAKALYSLNEISELHNAKKINYFMVLQYYEGCINAVDKLKEIKAETRITFA